MEYMSCYKLIIFKLNNELMTSLSMVSLVRMESDRHVESLEEGLVKVSLERLSVVTEVAVLNGTVWWKHLAHIALRL